VRARSVMRCCVGFLCLSIAHMYGIDMFVIISKYTHQAISRNINGINTRASTLAAPAFSSLLLLRYASSQAFSRSSEAAQHISDRYSVLLQTALHLHLVQSRTRARNNTRKAPPLPFWPFSSLRCPRPGFHRRQPTILHECRFWLMSPTILFAARLR